MNTGVIDLDEKKRARRRDAKRRGAFGSDSYRNSHYSNVVPMICDVQKMRRAKEGRRVLKEVKDPRRVSRRG